MKVDLHTHSTYSDGEYKPAKVLALAKKAGIKCLALTDHNSIAGIPEALEAGKKLGIEIVPGTEVFADCSEILGYYANFRNKKLCSFLKKMRKRVDNNSKKLIRMMSKSGWNVDYDIIRKEYGYPVMRIHVINYLSYKCGLSKKGAKKRFQELRLDIFYPDGEFYFETNPPKAEQVIRIIREAKGIPVLAHPWFEKGFEKRVPSLVKAGLWGIEVSSPGKTTEAVKKINKLCRRYNLFKTQGSDFHSLEKNPFGKYYCDYSIVEKLKDIKEKINRGDD